MTSFEMADSDTVQTSYVWKAVTQCTLDQLKQPKANLLSLSESARQQSIYEIAPAELPQSNSYAAWQTFVLSVAKS